MKCCDACGKLAETVTMNTDTLCEKHDITLCNICATEFATRYSDLRREYSQARRKVINAP